MWIIEISVVGLSCWAGPILCTVVAYDEKNNTCIKHTTKISVVEIDKTNTFRANISIRAKALNFIRKILPKGDKVKYVKTCGYISFNSPWPLKRIDHEPELAYSQAKSIHKRIMNDYDIRFPDWGFSEHNGDGTSVHRRLILSRKCGTKVHRRSFMPLARFYNSRHKTDSGYVN